MLRPFTGIPERSDKMNNENFHPTRQTPPVVHALHHWDKTVGILRYEYNGVDILEIQVPAGTELGFRHGSDGSMQSVQYIQQIYLASETPCRARVTVRLNERSLNMRPHRARSGQAILGTQPGLLSGGVNGMYDLIWDLLLDWHGKPWTWEGAQTTLGEDGFCTAVFYTQLDMSAFFLNIRPRYYQKHLGYQYHMPWLRRPKQGPVAGWCSWEAYRRDINAETICAVADFLEANLRGYGLQYLQVDDGYQAMPLPVDAKMTMAQGWMTCDPQKFPGGHDQIAGIIRARGLMPGVWVNANITNPEFPSQHPKSVIWNGQTPLKGEWIDFLYACDPQTLAAQVEPLFCRLREKGYRYIKIDAIRHLLFDGLHECVRLGLMDDGEAETRFRAFMEASAKGMGPEVYYLASWGEMHEVVGVVDACRISMDANPTWAGIRMQLFESARWFHTQRILFLNDPDHVCVRTKREWARSILSLISLSGELYMLSDAPEVYTSEKLEILQKTLPPLTTAAGETGPLPMEYPAYTWTKLHGFAVQSHETPVEMEEVSQQEASAIAGWAPDHAALHPFSSLWSFAMGHHGMQWRVMLRVATVPLRAGALALQTLALEPQKTYLAYDFWKQRYLGEITHEFPCGPLELGCCQAVAFYEKPNQPMVIGSDRHVSMDAVSITAHRYENGVLYLAIAGFPGQRIVYQVYAPPQFRLKNALVKGGELRTVQGDLITLSIHCRSENPEIQLLF